MEKKDNDLFLHFKELYIEMTSDFFNSKKTFNNFFHEKFIISLTNTLQYDVFHKKEQQKIYAQMTRLLERCNTIRILLRSYVKHCIFQFFKDYDGRSITSLHELIPYFSNDSLLHQQIIDIIKSLHKEDSIVLIELYNRYIEKIKKDPLVYQMKYDQKSISYAKYNKEIRHVYEKQQQNFNLLVNFIEQRNMYHSTPLSNKKTRLNNIDVPISELQYLLLHTDCFRTKRDDFYHIDDTKTNQIICQHCNLFNEKKMCVFLDSIQKKNNTKLNNLIKNKNNEYPLFIEKIITKENDVKYIIIGDIHCDLEAIICILCDLFKKNIIHDDYKIKDNYRIVFLGDMVDYGFYGLEILYIVLKLKYLNFSKVYIINGNHEDKQHHDCVGNNCRLEFGLEKKIKLKQKDTETKINLFLQSLPCACFIQYTNTTKKGFFQLCHGGIDLRFKNMNPYLKHKSNIVPLLFKNQLIYPKQIDLFVYNGFKWNDFTIHNDNITQSSRGDDIFALGKQTVYHYLEQNNILSIISGHQDTTCFSALLDDIHKQSKHFIYFNDGMTDLYELYNIEDDPLTVSLDPSTDFLACVTSTALTTKNYNRSKLIPNHTTLTTFTKKGRFRIRKTQKFDDYYYVSRNTIPYFTYLCLSKT